MKLRTLIMAALAATASTVTFLAVSPLKAEAEHHHASPEARTPAPGVNPLIEEMRKLDGVFKEIVSGVALGDGPRVHDAIEGMHGAMEKTRAALHSGSVKPPKNPGKLHEFELMDKEFHMNLERLAKAAHMNDGKGMLSLTKKLIDGCVGCHSSFRK